MMATITSLQQIILTDEKEQKNVNAQNFCHKSLLKKGKFYLNTQGTCCDRLFVGICRNDGNNHRD